MVSRAEDLRNEIESRRGALFKNNHIIEEMKNKVFYVPFLAMGSSLFTLYIGKRLIQSRIETPIKRPFLLQLGMGVAGALLGAQIGILWLQREYMKLDPEGKFMAELKEIGKELRELKTIEDLGYDDYEVNKNDNKNE